MPKKRVSSRILETSVSNQIIATPVYDKIIVGGGLAGLATAYEILSAAKEENRKVKIVVLAETINSPALAGSNICFGIDGYEADKYADPAQLKSEDHKVLGLVRDALPHLRDIVEREKIDCRLDMGYQLLGVDRSDALGAVDFLTTQFGYKNEEFHSPRDKGEIKFQGFEDAIETQAIGQINAPEFQKGLIEAIKNLGGEVITGVRYEDHVATKQGTEVRTNSGVYKSTTVPMLALGVGHLAKMNKLSAPIQKIYTGALHIQLDAEDAKKISDNGKPMAFCDTRLEGDVIWGSLDRKGVLTIGFGDSEEYLPEQNKVALLNKFKEIRPDIFDKYKDSGQFSYGPMLKAENMFPFVGRQKDCDVNSGWFTRGIVQSFAAARAYAKYFVGNDDSDLKLFERLNPAPLSPALDIKKDNNKLKL